MPDSDLVQVQENCDPVMKDFGLLKRVGGV
jgi:hypothetical protein